MFWQQKFSGGPPGQNKQLSGFVAGAGKSASPESVLCALIQGFIFIRSYGYDTEGFNIAKQININNFNDFVKNSFANYLQTCNKRAYIWV